MGEIAEALERDKNITKTVDKSILQALLPEELDDFLRIEVTSHITGGSSMQMTIARAEYASQDSKNKLTITLTDAGRLRSLGGMTLKWLEKEFDKTTDNGYQRTVTHEGAPGFEVFERDGNQTSGSYHLFVGDRFWVKIHGENVTEEQLEDARAAIDVDALEDLKSTGITQEATAE